MERREGDKVGFVEGFESEEGVTDLFDVDCAGKGRFLGIVALKLEKAYVSVFRSVGYERHTCTPCLSFVMQ